MFTGKSWRPSCLQLQHRWFPMNIVEFLRTSILKNGCFWTSGIIRPKQSIRIMKYYHLTHFSPIFHFCTLWKRQKTFRFLPFLGGYGSGTLDQNNLICINSKVLMLLETNTSDLVYKIFIYLFIFGGGRGGRGVRLY